MTENFDDQPPASDMGDEHPDQMIGAEVDDPYGIDPDSFEVEEDEEA